MFSNLLFPGSQVAGASLGSSEHKAGTLPAQDSLLSQGHSDPPTLTQTGTQQSPTVYIFGVWVETGVPRENPCKNRKNLELHTVALAGN